MFKNPELTYPGERFDTIHATYFFPYTLDSRFINHPKTREITELINPQLTIPLSELSITELEIKDKITVSRLIPSPEESWRIHPETGLACRDLNGIGVEQLFDPDNSQVINSLDVYAQRLLAHELTHIKRKEELKLHPNLLGAIISEGIGVYYEENWQGIKFNSHWGHVLNDAELVYETQRAQQELDNPNFDFSDWFYGNKGGHRRFAGYSLGYAIIGNFMKHNPNTPIAELAVLPAETIYYDSSFRA